MEIKSLNKDVVEKIKSSYKINNILTCVTELVLNSLDAKSTCIAVRINFLNYKIQVVDNGNGISKKNLEHVCYRHMTSKLNNLYDLKIRRYIYGFKGECLSSIAELSKSVNITSKELNQNQTYSKTIIKGKHEKIIKANDRPSNGTTITLEGIFYKFPVRQKRIKSEFEIEEIIETLTQLSIVHPETSFSLRDDVTGKLLFKRSKLNSIIESVINLCTELKENDFSLVKVKKSRITVECLFLKNKLYKKKIQYFYVNMRPVLCSRIYTMLNSVLSKNKKSKIFDDKFPFFVLNLKCPLINYNLIQRNGKLTVDFKNWEIVDRCIEKLLKNFCGEEDVEIKNISMEKKSCGLSMLAGVVKGYACKEDVRRKNDCYENEIEIEQLSEDSNSIKFKNNTEKSCVVRYRNLMRNHDDIFENGIPDTFLKTFNDDENKGKELIMYTFLKSNEVFKGFTDTENLQDTIMESKICIRNDVISKRAKSTKTLSMCLKVKRKRNKIKRKKIMYNSENSIISNEIRNMNKPSEMKDSFSSNNILEMDGINLNKMEITTNDLNNFYVDSNIQNCSVLENNSNFFDTNNGLVSNFFTLNNEDISYSNITDNKIVPHFNKKFNPMIPPLMNDEIQHSIFNTNNITQKFLSNKNAEKVLQRCHRKKEHFHPHQKLYKFDDNKIKEKRIIDNRFNEDNFQNISFYFQNKRSKNLNKVEFNPKNLHFNKNEMLFDITIKTITDNIFPYFNENMANLTNLTQKFLNHKKTLKQEHFDLQKLPISPIPKAKKEQIELKSLFKHPSENYIDGKMTNLYEGFNHRNNHKNLRINTVIPKKKLKTFHSDNDALYNCKKIEAQKKSIDKLFRVNYLKTPNKNSETNQKTNKYILSQDSLETREKSIWKKFTEKKKSLVQDINLKKPRKEPLHSKIIKENKNISSDLFSQYFNKNKDPPISNSENFVCQSKTKKTTLPATITLEKLDPLHFLNKYKDDVIFNTTNNSNNIDKNSINVDQLEDVLNNVEKINDPDNNFIPSEWEKQTDNKGVDFYHNKRSGITTYKMPKIDCESEFIFNERLQFLPKGFSPIMKKIDPIEKPLSPLSREKFKDALIESYDDELVTIKWQNYLKNNDPKSFFNEMYKEKLKSIEGIILEVDKCGYMPSKSMDFMRSKTILRDMNVIGQIDKKFIAAFNDKLNILFLFDQHAVHERIRLESLQKEYEDASIECEKVTLFMQQNDLKHLKQKEEYLKQIGFDCAFFKNGMTVHKIPLSISKKSRENNSLSKTIKLIIEDILRVIKKQKGVITGLPPLIRNIINSEACRGAIKFGDILTKEEMEGFIEKLYDCILPFQCAHGRPTMTPILDFNKIISKVEKVKMPTLNVLV